MFGVEQDLVQQEDFAKELENFNVLIVVDVMMFFLHEENSLEKGSLNCFHNTKNYLRKVKNGSSGSLR